MIGADYFARHVDREIVHWHLLISLLADDHDLVNVYHAVTQFPTSSASLRLRPEIPHDRATVM